jgi:hypothetical protein
MKNMIPMQVLVRTCLETSPAPCGGMGNRPASAVNATDRADMPLHVLKRRMLLSALEETPDTGLFKRLCGAANQAADLAWATPAPARTFPVFFQDLVLAIRDQSFGL